MNMTRLHFLTWLQTCTIQMAACNAAEDLPGPHIHWCPGTFGKGHSSTC